MAEASRPAKSYGLKFEEEGEVHAGPVSMTGGGIRFDSVPKFSGPSATAADVEELDGLHPFIVTDAVGKDYADWWCGQVLEQLGDRSVLFIEGKASGKRTLLEGTLGVFAEESARLSDRKGFAYMQSDEVLLEAMELLTAMRANLPRVVPAAQGEDHFLQWPRGLAPGRLSLHVAGAGSRTGLGRSGLGGTSWMLCLKGHMRFKIFTDDPERLGALSPEESVFGVFNEDNQKPLIDVCKKWESEVDLYATENGALVDQLGTFGPDLARFPETRDLPACLEVLLGPREVLVYPASWWCQGYCDDATWAVSSSYLSERRLDSCLHGLLRHCGIDPATMPSLGALPPRSRIDAALASAIHTKGLGDGRKVLENLRKMDASNEEEQHKALALKKAQTSAGSGATAPPRAGPPGAEQPLCQVCGRKATTKCGRCKDFWLCGVECQRRSWGEHKKECRIAR